MEKIRILLIEDNRLLREGIAIMLEKHGEFEVIATAENGDTLHELKRLNKNPDVVLLDLGLHNEDSFKLMEFLKKELPETRIIAMDILPEQEDLREFVEAGGSGFILKDASIEDFFHTIKQVVYGEKVLPPLLTVSLFSQIVENSMQTGKTDVNNAIRLTNREREIVDLISDGLSNKEIAARLHIATFTVKSHVHNILEKLTLSTRLQVAAFAHRQKTERSGLENDDRIDNGTTI
ncbi:response regulator transcription factor [candidate division KSB1 bacterium]|nr:response regulator transcription factor [candidate division KSB1 bacterium]